MKHVQRAAAGRAAPRGPRSRPRWPPSSSAPPPRRRATATPTVDEMVHDLEEVLAIEAARAGEATGEATTVLRSLPGDTADFAPGGCATRAARCSLDAALLGAGGRGDRAASPPAPRRAPGRAADAAGAGLSEVALAADAAHDYDPEGDGERVDTDAGAATRSTAIRPPTGTPRPTAAASRRRQDRRRASTWTPAARSPPAGSTWSTLHARLRGARSTRADTRARRHRRLDACRARHRRSRPDAGSRSTPRAALTATTWSGSSAAPGRPGRASPS